MDRRTIAVLLFAVAVAACSRGDARANATSASTHDSAGAAAPASGSESGAVASNAGEVSAGASAGRRAPNLQGRIPVLEYHVIADKNSEYTRTAASYRADLEEAYKLGFRPITISQ